MSAKQWHSAQIFYYEEPKDGLVLDCVRPVFRAVAPAVSRLFFVRHWLHGPHVRLCVLTDEPSFRDLVRPEIERHTEAYLARSPSTARVDAAELLAAHQALAVQERETGPLTPLFPDNSVRYEPYDRRVGVLGSEAAARLLEDFYHETNETAFLMLDRVRAGDNRLVLALDLMFATAHAMWPDIRRGFISYRSHSEGFIVQAADPEARRAACEEKYRSQAEGLRDRLRAVLETLDDGRETVPFVVDWVSRLGDFRRRAEPLIASGEIAFGGGEDRETGRTWGADLLRHSTFHRLLQGNGALLATMREDPGFLGFRLALNYMYLHLNRIGIRPFERFVLCYLAAATVEDYFGVRADDFVAQPAGSW
ncbi:thiopeptide maturation pyridine synthase [Microbispora sp. NPDC046933]|uniref:thiopeptide maturation pyridine synthase n=1 Tax=Microbispora sp. NPDC046933 TaxID=3155618 RepID=UPI00340DD068